jgi:hypothetical protein
MGVNLAECLPLHRSRTAARLDPRPPHSDLFVNIKINEGLFANNSK